jgi:hypothetical protein
MMLELVKSIFGEFSINERIYTQHNHQFHEIHINGDVQVYWSSTRRSWIIYWIDLGTYSGFLVYQPLEEEILREFYLRYKKCLQTKSLLSDQMNSLKKEVSDITQKLRDKKIEVLLND